MLEINELEGREREGGNSTKIDQGEIRDLGLSEEFGFSGSRKVKLQWCCRKVLEKKEKKANLDMTVFAKFQKLLEILVSRRINLELLLDEI